MIVETVKNKPVNIECLDENECGLVSRYEADKAIMHLNFANRRMLIAIITVCVTAIVISIGSILHTQCRSK